MVFLLFFLLIILAIITIRIKIEFENFEFNSKNEQHLNQKYQIKTIVYIYKFIPILKSKITHEKVKRLINNEKVKNIIKEQEVKFIKNEKDIDFEIIRNIKNVKIQIDKLNLNIIIGTEDAALTAFIIPIISTFLALFLSKKIEKYNSEQLFSITPIYINQNLINIEFSGIFQIRMIHIINTICILNKKRKGDKNERTSNRRSYDYGYE